MYVLSYSKSQNCFHIEHYTEYLNHSFRSIKENADSDYKAIAMNSDMDMLIEMTRNEFGNIDTELGLESSYKRLMLSSGFGKAWESL